MSVGAGRASFLAHRQQRPAALRVGRSGAARAENHAGLSGAAARAIRPLDVGAQRVQGIVGDQSAPTSTTAHRWIRRDSRRRRPGAADRRSWRRLIPAPRAAFLRALSEAPSCGRAAQKQRKLVGEIERDAPIAFADRLHAGPSNFAGSDERVQARQDRSRPGVRGGLPTPVATPARARPGDFQSRRAARRDEPGRSAAAPAIPANASGSAPACTAPPAPLRAAIAPAIYAGSGAESPHRTTRDEGRRGRKPPSSTRPSCASWRSTASTSSISSPKRSAASRVVNGPWVRA